MFEDLKNQSSNSSWESSEAALFIMTAVAKNIMPYVYIVLNLLLYL